MTRAVVVGLAALAAMLAVSSPAHADTVDAAMRPFLVGGGILFGALFAYGAWIFIARGIAARKLALDSAGWPTAQGTIVASQIRVESRSPSPNNRYDVFIPEARYSYAVAGRSYEGRVIRTGIKQFGYAQRDAAEAHLKPYQPGNAVAVRHDPAEPNVSVLEIAEYGSGRNIFGGSLFALLAIGAFALALMLASMATH